VTVEDIARVAHTLNRAHCEALGEFYRLRGRHSR
jgi:hypothetical protein